MPGRKRFGFAAAVPAAPVAPVATVPVVVPVVVPIVLVVWCLLALAVLSLAPARPALAGTSAAIQVEPGAAGALVTGAVIRGERDVYRLAAKAGQTLHVEIVSVEENAAFQIFLPGKGNKTLPGAGETDDAAKWNGTLPKTGAYRIVVGAARGNAEYTLRVDLAEPAQ